MADEKRTRLLLEYLQVLSNLKLANYYANTEIKKVMEIIEVELGLR